MPNDRFRLQTPRSALGASVLALSLSALVACAPEPAAEPVDDEPEVTFEATAEEVEEEVAGAVDELGEEVEALRIKATVLSELGLDAAGIDIELNGRTAVLTGDVESESTRDLAEEIVLAAEQVDEVENALRIEPSEGDGAGTPVGDRVAEAELEVRDAVLEARVKANVMSELGTTAFDIEVEASRGKVSLRGAVEDDARKEIALQAARTTEGVTEVIDLIEVARS